MNVPVLPLHKTLVKIWASEWNCRYCHEKLTLFNSFGQNNCLYIHKYQPLMERVQCKVVYYYPCCKNEIKSTGCLNGDHMPSIEWIRNNVPKGSNIITITQIVIPLEFISNNRLKSTLNESRIISTAPVNDPTTNRLDAEKSYYVVRTSDNPLK